MSKPWVIDEADESAVVRLANFLALILRPGDVIALAGELGAGKTTFARAVIRAVMDDPGHDVPSPSFPLVQGYESERLPISHFDFYRLRGSDELEELGFDEALAQGAVLIEWPEKAANALPDDRLNIRFDDDTREDRRRVTLTAKGSWQPRLHRLRALMTFCGTSPWGDARPVFLQGDASTRSYARLLGDGATAILMDSPPQSDGPVVREGKPYSKLVHLAEDVRPFVAVACALKDAGLAVPSIIAHDLEQGFLIISDLGYRVFSKEKGKSPKFDVLYRASLDVLIHLKGHPPAQSLPLPDGSIYSLPEFDREAFLFEAELLLDWFYEAVRGAPPEEAARREFVTAFEALHDSVAGEDTAWVLRDYHSPNLLWLPEGEGIGRVGVIDFQDAMRGHAAYDVVSLLQDARRDIPAQLEGQLYAYYCETRASADSDFDAQAFARAYAVFGAQRSSKILGIFARLAKRDGKHGYLAHIPHVSDYLDRNLAHPALSDLRAWFDQHLPKIIRTAPLKI